MILYARLIKLGVNMKARSILGWILRFIVLVVLFNVLFIVGSHAVTGLIPNIKSEPGLVSAETGC